jgi:hypothetical protein
MLLARLSELQLLPQSVYELLTYFFCKSPANLMLRRFLPCTRKQTGRKAGFASFTLTDSEGLE